jgi:hypothetical protein
LREASLRRAQIKADFRKGMLFGRGYEGRRGWCCRKCVERLPHSGRSIIIAWPPLPWGTAVTSTTLQPSLAYLVGGAHRQCNMSTSQRMRHPLTHAPTHPRTHAPTQLTRTRTPFEDSTHKRVLARVPACTCTQRRKGKQTDAKE